MERTPREQALVRVLRRAAWQMDHGGRGERPQAKYPRRVPALQAENVLAFSLERARFRERVNEGGTADNSLSFN